MLTGHVHSAYASQAEADAAKLRVEVSRTRSRITADLILDGHSDLIEASQLSVKRFGEGRMLEETAVL